MTTRDRPRAKGGARATKTVVAVLGVVLGMLTWNPARRYVSAARLLARLGTPVSESRARGTTTDLVIRDGALSFRARLYLPRGATYRCLVIGHGVHYRGIDEPRLTRFATELSGVGIAVLTPELSDLADYRITALGADVLGASVRKLGTLCHAAESKVGLLGFSFAGGLSLLAAEDPAVGGRLAYVASVGGYDDLRRVREFLLTDRVETLHGPEPRKAHEYGLVVLVYEHIDAFVPEEDYAVMRGAVKAWLHEDRGLAWTFASQRTTARAEALFMAIATSHRDGLRETLAAVLKNEDDASALSPGGKLKSILPPVYLLHGSGDSVIPPEETAWADRELGGHPHRALITPLIEHVEVSHAPSVKEQIALVDFMARLL